MNNNSKISDCLKTLEKADVQACKIIIRASLKIGNQQHLEVTVNYFAYLYLSERVSDVATQIKEDWRRFRAYITTALGTSQKSNFSLASFDRNAIELANTKYHRDLAAKSKSKGPKGLSVVKIDEALESFKNNHPDIKAGRNFVPAIWKGWSWVSLGCGHSSEEAAAAGHCGNAGSERGDNILSLRDGFNRVHLTFITNINTGALGEAKGVENNKPTPSYHPAIVALLLSGYVIKIKEEGYEPENDFKIDDLKNAHVKRVVKEHLNNAKEHKRPENYLPWKWIFNKDQKTVDALPSNEKIEFLREVIKIIDNHEPFTSHNWDVSTLETPRPSNLVKRPDFEIPATPPFDLNKLTIECLEHIDKLKLLLAILEDIRSIHNQLRATFKDEWTTWFDDEEEKDRDYDRAKVPAYDIEWKTILLYVDKALQLTESGSTRDKEVLIEALESIGFNDTGAPHYIDLRNKFYPQIQQLIIENVDAVIKRGHANPVEYSTITNYIQSVIYPYEFPEKIDDPDNYHNPLNKENKTANHQHTEISRDGKTLIGYFCYSTDCFSKIVSLKYPKSRYREEQTIKLTEQEKIFLHTVRSLCKKHLNLLKRHGYSCFLDAGNKKDRFAQYAYIHLKQMIIRDSMRRIEIEFKGNTASKHNGDYGGPEVKIYVPIVDGLKAVRNGEIPAPYKKLDEMLQSIEVVYFNRNLPKLEKWLLSNIENVVTYVNAPKEKLIKGKDLSRRMVEIPRDVQLSQHGRKLI